MDGLGGAVLFWVARRPADGAGPESLRQELRDRGEPGQGNAVGDRPTLCIDVRMIHASGIGTYIRGILPRLLAADRFAPILLGEPAELGRYEWSMGLRTVPCSLRIYSPGEALRLGAHVPACDLFWSPHVNVPLLPCRARRRLVTIHDCYHLAFIDSFNPLKRLYARLLYRAAVRRSDRIITDSAFSRSQLVELAGADERRIVVIPVGVDRSMTDAVVPIDRDRPYMLFVGNVKPNKNLPRALSAFAAIADACDWDFVIVGKREGFRTGDTEVDDVAARLGDRVHFTGELATFDEVKSYYAGASLFVMPSYYEGFGLPLAEAMAFGLPVICANAASLPEVGGECVRYFDPFDEADIARVMAEAVRAHPVPIDQACYDRQLGRFDWDASANAHLDLMQSLVG